jgi:hypothetical protein
MAHCVLQAQLFLLLLAANFCVLAAPMMTLVIFA